MPFVLEQRLWIRKENKNTDSMVSLWARYNALPLSIRLWVAGSTFAVALYGNHYMNKLEEHEKHLQNVRLEAEKRLAAELADKKN